MLVRDIAVLIEEFAPLSLQESYDNAGLVVGRPEDEVHGVLIAVDVTEEVIEEALSKGCDMIVTHHPIIFHALKRFNSEGPVQRCVEKAIRSGVALYAAHTNLDSAPHGMSWHVGRKLGLENMEILEQTAPGCGFGVVGDLPQSRPLSEMFAQIHTLFSAPVIRHTAPRCEMVKRVAVCTGSGGSLMGLARRSGCDLYLTSDLRYNDFFEPCGEFVVADIGHFETEFCAIEILYDILSKKITNFALHKSALTENPIKYDAQ